jgi:hypothetical protein
LAKGRVSGVKQRKRKGTSGLLPVGETNLPSGSETLRFKQELLILQQ